jgi:hypothetical protein
MVGQAFYLLTATWLAGQGADLNLISVGDSAHASTVDSGCQEECGFWKRCRARFQRNCDCNCDERPGLWQRMCERISCLRKSCGCSDDAGSCQPGGDHDGGPSIEPIKKMPTAVKVSEPPVNRVPQKQQSADSLTITTFRPATTSRAIAPRFADKVGHEADYSWITGQLRKDNGRWVLHYATPETVDRFGGSLPFFANADMSRFHDGDLVSVHGQLLTSGTSPMYHATSVDLVESASK